MYVNEASSHLDGQTNVPVNPNAVDWQALDPATAAPNQNVLEDDDVLEPVDIAAKVVYDGGSLRATEVYGTADPYLSKPHDNAELRASREANVRAAVSILGTHATIGEVAQGWATMAVDHAEDLTAEAFRAGRRQAGTPADPAA